jgi:hypothetical protein
MHALEHVCAARQALIKIGMQGGQQQLTASVDAQVDGDPNNHKACVNISADASSHSGGQTGGWAVGLVVGGIKLENGIVEEGFRIILWLFHNS